MDDIHRILGEIRELLALLVEKTQETNSLLKDGIKTRWGHSMSMLEMDPERFKKNEGKEKHF